MERSPADARLADEAHDWKSAYVHLPFCRRRCPYCDFAIVDETGGPVDVAGYLDSVIAEIDMEPDFAVLDAINFGGGTPSRIAPGDIERVIAALEGRFGLVPGVEVSIEVNPEDWGDGYAQALVDAGVTRVSVGAQSMDDQVLGILGRMHDVESVAAVVSSARDAGFRSISLDLIFGHPAESDASWQRTVVAALDLEPDHVSTYALTVEAGTDLARSIADGESPPDGDVQADRYDWFLDASSAAGFERYEVSNHARVGHACRYNLSTWAQGEYVAFGLGAHDHRWGVRRRNFRSLERYLEAVASGIRPVAGSETLTEFDERRDRLMLGLRLAAGTPISDVASAFLSSEEGAALVAAGVVAIVNERVLVTNPMLADAAARAALSVSASDC